MCLSHKPEILTHGAKPKAPATRHRRARITSMNEKVFCILQVRTHPRTTMVSPTRPKPPSSPPLMSAIRSLFLNSGTDDEGTGSTPSPPSLSSITASAVSITFDRTLRSRRTHGSIWGGIPPRPSLVEARTPVKGPARPRNEAP